MTIPASLSKLKSLFPVIVVGASVAITIKLLTESTPLTSEILQVKAEEDIFSPDYKDELVEPKEPEATPPREQKSEQEPQESKGVPEKSDDKKSEDSGKNDEKDKESQSQEQQKQKQNQKKEEKKPSRKFGGPFRDVFSAIFNKKG